MMGGMREVRFGGSVLLECFRIVFSSATQEKHRNNTGENVPFGIKPESS